MSKSRRPRVVIADDLFPLRHLLKSLLSGLKYEVVAEANDGREAFNAVKSYKPDIVCLDIHMPGVNGLHALEKIKALDPEIIVIMITASNEPDEVQQAIRQGADGYILKPFASLQIHQAIQKARERKRQDSTHPDAAHPDSTNEEHQ